MAQVTNQSNFGEYIRCFLTGSTSSWQRAQHQIWTVSCSMWLATILQRPRQSAGSLLVATMMQLTPSGTLMKRLHDFASLNGVESTVTTSLSNATVNCIGGFGVTLYRSTLCAGHTWKRIVPVSWILIKCQGHSCPSKFGQWQSSMISGPLENPSEQSSTSSRAVSPYTLGLFALLWVILLLSEPLPTWTKPLAMCAGKDPVDPTTPPPAAPPSSWKDDHLKGRGWENGFCFRTETCMRHRDDIELGYCLAHLDRQCLEYNGPTN